MPILQMRTTEAQRGEMTCRHSHSEGVVAPVYNYYPLHYDSESLKRTLRKRVSYTCPAPYHLGGRASGDPLLNGQGGTQAAGF